MECLIGILYSFVKFKLLYISCILLFLKLSFKETFAIYIFLEMYNSSLAFDQPCLNRMVFPAV